MVLDLAQDPAIVAGCRSGSDQIVAIEMLAVSVAMTSADAAASVGPLLQPGMALVRRTRGGESTK
jgi:hypothetical protein